MSVNSLYNLGNYGTTGLNYSSLLGNTSSLSSSTASTGLSSLYSSLGSLGLSNTGGLDGFSSLFNTSGLTGTGTATQADLGQMMQQMLGMFQALSSNLGLSGSTQGNGPQGPPPPPEVMMEQADTDTNGALSQDEFNAFQPTTPDGQALPSISDQQKKTMFTKLDKDGDGSVTLQELQAGRPPHPGQCQAANT